MAEVKEFGLDLAKNVFEVAGIDARERKVVGRRLRRAELLRWFSRQPRVRVTMETCPGSHYWAKELEKLGFPVKMIPASATKAYRQGPQKNDRRDAVAIARAGRSEQVPAVRVKSESQLQIQALFTRRRLLTKHRVALGNQMRGQLLEFGVALAKSDKSLRAGVEEALSDSSLPAVFREVLAASLEDYRETKAKEDQLERRIEALVKEEELGRRLLELPGVGPLTAGYVVGVLGGTAGCRSGREFAARIGLVPRQHSSGDRVVLGKITKRGDRILRSLLVHGGRSVLNPRSKRGGKLAEWGREVAERRGFNRATVAVANKLARQLWAVSHRYATEG